MNDYMRRILYNDEKRYNELKIIDSLQRIEIHVEIWNQRIAFCIVQIPRNFSKYPEV